MPKRSDSTTPGRMTTSPGDPYATRPGSQRSPRSQPQPWPPSAYGSGPWSSPPTSATRCPSPRRWSRWTTSRVAASRSASAPEAPGGTPPYSAQRPGRSARGRIASPKFVEVLDLLLREPAASYRGRYYSAVEARTYPGCVQEPRVPFAVAAAAGRGMRLAARLGQMWVTVGDVAHSGPPQDSGARVDGRPRADGSARRSVRRRWPSPGVARPPGAHRPAARRRAQLGGRVRRDRGAVRGGGRHRHRGPLAPRRRALPG